MCLILGEHRRLGRRGTDGVDQQVVEAGRDSGFVVAGKRACQAAV